MSGTLQRQTVLDYPSEDVQIFKAADVMTKETAQGLQPSRPSSTSVPEKELGGAALVDTYDGGHTMEPRMKLGFKKAMAWSFGPPAILALLFALVAPNLAYANLPLVAGFITGVAMVICSFITDWDKA